MRPLPIGIRSNNPGNLRPLPNFEVYQGQTGISPENLLIFETIERGYRALALTLRAYGHCGWNRLIIFSAHYAPRGDGANDPVEDARAMSELTGFALDQKLDFEDMATCVAMARARTRVENGNPNDYGLAVWFPDPVIKAGVISAFAAPLRADTRPLIARAHALPLPSASDTLNADPKLTGVAP